MERFSTLDVFADGALRTAKADPRAASSMLSIAKGLGFTVLRVPSDELPDGAEALMHGSLLGVRTGLSAVEERWAIAHELGHHICGHAQRTADCELEAEYVAACLVIPRKALRCAVMSLGHELSVLARAFVASQTAVALRLGECGQVSAVAVLAKHVTYARSLALVDMPPKLVVQRLFAAAANHNAVRFAQLSDSRRVALLAA